MEKRKNSWITLPRNINILHESFYIFLYMCVCLIKNGTTSYIFFFCVSHFLNQRHLDNWEFLIVWGSRKEIDVFWMSVYFRALVTHYLVLPGLWNRVVLTQEQPSDVDVTTFPGFNFLVLPVPTWRVPEGTPFALIFIILHWPLPDPRCGFVGHSFPCFFFRSTAS